MSSIAEQLFQAYQAGERNFARIQLSNADLADADLSGANFQSANFQGANLRRTNFSGSNLQQANFTAAKFYQTNLSWCDLSKQNFEQASLTKVDLQGADLRDANLSMANLTEAKLDAANLNGAVLTNAILHNAYMVYAQLQHANLSAAELLFADLTGVDLSQANLDRANLTRVRLRKANLSQASLQKTYLQDCNLQLANFTKANLQQASLKDAQCGEANFTQADLRGVETHLAQNVNLESAITGEIDRPFKHSLYLEIESSGGFSFSSDSRTLAYKQHNDQVLLMDIETGKQISNFELPRFEPTVSAVFDSSGKTLHYLYYVNEFHLLNPKTGQIINKLKNHSANVTSMVLNSQAEIISKTGIGTSDPIDVGHEVRTFGNCDRIQTTAYSPCGKYIAKSNSTSGKVKLLNRATGSIIRTFDEYKKPVQSLSFSPDSRLLATYGAEDVRVYQVETGIATYKTYNSGGNSFFPTIAFAQLDNQDPVLITNCCFTVTGYRKATSSSKRDILYSWNGSGGSRSQSSRIAYSADGKIAARRYYEQPVQIWDVSTGTELATVDLKEFSYLLSLNHNGNLLAAVTNKSDLGLWDIQTNQLIHQFTAHSDYINSVQFSSDHKILASAGRDRTIKLWDIATGKLITTFTEYSSITSLSFHPTKPILASGNADGIIILWNLETYEEVYRYTAHLKPQKSLQSGQVRSVKFSPDGNYLASKGAKLCLWEFEEFATQ